MFSASNASSTLSDKITKIVMLTCTSVILLTLLVAVTIQGTNLRNSMIDKMSTLAKVIGESSKKSLALSMKYQAAPVLATLKTEPTIEAAYLFNQNNELFGQYLNRNNITFAEIIRSKTFKLEELKQAEKNHIPIFFFTTQNFRIYSPIFHDGEYLGSVYLQASLNTMLTDLMWFLIASLIMLFVSLMVAYLLTIRLQPLIITPLQQLVDRMKTVTEDKIYQLDRQPVVHNDIAEISELQAGFDEMLVQINRRQEKLQKHSDLLEEQVMRRTHDLQQSNEVLRKTVTELDVARKEAVEASAAKSRFLANMSHEIRTPMIGVLGMAELLLKKTTDSYQRELTLTIHNSGESLLAILNDLLDISKIEAGKLELEHNLFNPVETLERAVELLADNAFTKGLELTTIPDPALPEMLIGDAERLRQIILNLLSNAIKFTSEGQISVAMSGTQLTGNKLELRIEVCDSGIGVSDDAKKKIFSAFTQADSSTTRNYGGTGLGLTIVSQLVELMGGKIVVSDQEPHGSCFIVTAALTTAHQHLPAPSASSIAKHALIVTENSDLEKLLNSQLKAMGCHSIAVKSPATISQALASTSMTVDLIFIDQKGWPHGDTFDFVQQPNVTTKPRLVVITQRQHILGEKLKQEWGIDAFLTKPIKINDLKNLMLTETIPPSSTENAAISQSVGHVDLCEHQDVKPHILLAEDNPTNQRLAQLILEQNGYQLTIVSNGLQAVDAAENDRFDLILMDCQMPEMDGYTAAKKIREQYTTPIVALTAHVSDADIEQCSLAGMDAYLCKPYKQQQLLDVIDSFVDNKASISMPLQEKKTESH